MSGHLAKDTEDWTLDASDELAVRNGCYMHLDRGHQVVEWVADNLRLYQGDCAGQPFEMEDWQFDATVRLFGWVRNSEEYGRAIRRFRKASIWLPKKNGKSPLLAAWAIYLFCGDGEQGQNCYITAKNGNQVRENVGRHIHEMIRQSPALSAECELDKRTKRVFNEPTRSVIAPLSSENIQTQKALEGLNGSVFVDETHVVDKQHMSRLSRAGISRSEPLHVELSTAGDDPESYGMGRFRYAEGVISGAHKDDQTLAIIYAAPQQVTAAEIHADPIRFGRMANPSMPAILKESEFLHDYQTSKDSLSEFAQFCMYRLNIWQQSSSPWISLDDWQTCPATPYRPDPDRPVYAGLDLSRTTDFTAWVLFQPGGEGKPSKLWGHYWCPRSRAEELSGQFEIPILEWEREGWVTLCDDRVIPRRMVHDQIEQDANDYAGLKFVGYDRALMSDTVEFCEDDCGLEPVDLAQGVLTLNAPSQRLHEMVVGQELDTSGDPVMRWMIGNSRVRPDNNGNIKPLKQVGGIRKHIDGVVALVMAICVSTSHAEHEGPSMYESEGMLAL